MELGKNKIKDLLSHHPVFSHCERTFIDTLSECKLESFHHQKIFFKENRSNKGDFLVLLSGKIEVLSHSGILTTLDEGAIIGGGGSNHYRSHGESSLLIIPNHFIDSFAQKNPGSAFRLYESLHKQTLLLVETLNQKALTLIEEKKWIGSFIIQLTVMLAIFAAGITFFQKFIHRNSLIFVTTPLLLIASILLIMRMIKDKISLSEIGLNTKNLRVTIRYALFLSLISAFLIFIFKMISPIFFPKLSHPGFLTQFPPAFFLIYPLNAICEDILIRGGIQGLLVRFLENRHKNLIAILLSSLVFAGTHSAQGIGVVIAFFVTSLFWGWMYYKQENIIGVMLTHVIIGYLFLTVIGGF